MASRKWTRKINFWQLAKHQEKVLRAIYRYEKFMSTCPVSGGVIGPCYEFINSQRHREAPQSLMDTLGIRIPNSDNEIERGRSCHPLH